MKCNTLSKGCSTYYKKLKTLINTYRGFRLANKLPSHGQNTHSNGKTAKK